MGASKGAIPWNKGNGEGWINERGYRCLKIDGREFKVHRLVMEKKLGRKLEPHELVHHIDEDKLNNDPDNLALKEWGLHTSEHHKGLKRSEYTKQTMEVVANYRWELERTRLINSDLLEALEKIHSAGLAAVGYKNSPLGIQVQSAIKKATV